MRRSEVTCPIFGSGSELSQNMLPTYENIMKLFIFVSQDYKKQYNNCVRKSSEIVAEKVEEVWRRASIPIVEHKTILARIIAYHAKYRTLLKPHKSRKDEGSYKEKLLKFSDESKRLFDIATCKCLTFEDCKCPRDRKVPILERDFLTDQRTHRKMKIGSLDREATKKIERNMLRTHQQEEYKKKCLLSKFEPTSSKNYQKNTPSNVPKIEPRDRKLDIETQVSQLSSIPSTSSESSPTVAKIKLPVVARTLDRYGISDRAGAAIISAAFEDIGLITESDSMLVIDRSKVRRARSRARTALVNEPLSVAQEIFGLFFDGRKDKTLVYEDNRRKLVHEEHITILKEPDSVYLGHISPTAGNARMICRDILSFLTSKSIDTNNLLAVGCDGTAVNTGSKGGILRLLESHFGRPLQWLICSLHANELTLRHLFQHLDGTTTGPNSFKGPIGKALANCELLPIVIFHPIQCNLPEISKSKQELSTDQLYLLEICQSINNGSLDENLAKRNPGKIVQSRWLTTANRLLRLYVSTETPSENLRILVTFILTVYAPMWFKIKVEPFCIYGAKHLFETVKLSRYLPVNLKSVIDPVIQRNAFFAHSENVLLAMLADYREHVRELALRRILKIRRATSDSGTVLRIFEVPTLNLNADDYIDLIDWENITEPPLTKNITTEIICQAIIEPQIIQNEILKNIKNLPCHTQATERCVKLVTESSSAVCGPIRREGFIKNKLQSCHFMPKFNTKREYRSK